MSPADHPPSGLPVTVSPAEWDASVQALLAAGRAEDALQTLTRAAEGVSQPARFGELLNLFLTLPPQVREGREGVRLHLRLLGNVRPAGEVRQLAEWALGQGLEAPFVHAVLAWSLAREDDYAGALVAADRALAGEAELAPHEAGAAWRVRGRSLAHLGREGWQAAFARAAAFVTGRALGILRMEEGALLGRSGDQAGALRAYAEALTHFRHDGHHRAWTLHNMGLACLVSGRFEEAEGYFARVTAIRRGAEAARARAWCGQAAARRALGEWARAAALYRQAAAEAERQGDLDDVRQALRGLGHTLRLSGQTFAALEPLTQATRAAPGDRASGTSWVHVDLAAAHAALGQAERAEAVLALTGPLEGEDEGRARIVRAELARQRGDRAGALALLRPLNPDTLWAREEAHAFPGLFALLSAAGLPTPAPLPRPARTLVRVRAMGTPRVEVGGRPVPLGGPGLAVLCALLDGGGEGLTDLLAEVVEDGTPRPPRLQRQRVSAAVRAVRDALGWPGSVGSVPGGYRLDPAAEWHYDVGEALRRGDPVETFLPGVSLPWVLAREQELRQRDANLLSGRVD
ncbi:tetratricopeptide repeat protein [Deinococcus sp. NW-56]|uniref:tetratricopeptide repeat protein n=1 Tax=Deinococcus sp. NW-56 TaxID=2080419 RepID=UPI001319E46F|nr:tetratricopeptide repeat protein [Deinococcus sp. NW-56]